jgi:acyl dehydratase
MRTFLAREHSGPRECVHKNHLRKVTMMSDETTLEFSDAPALGPLYRRMIFSRRKGLPIGASLPPLRAVWKAIAPDPKRIQAYQDICGLSDSDALPPLYPFVRIAGLPLALMSHPVFPLSSAGLVHARQQIIQRRPVGKEEILDAECHITGQRPVKAGLEFEMFARLSSDGETVYESLSTFLARGKFGEAEEVPGGIVFAPPESPDPSLEKQWRVPNNMGRRYARTASDYNPIHISSLLAKLFGFRKAIIHGMWSAARCLGELPALDAAQTTHYAFAFKGPVFVGSSVTMQAQTEGDEHTFALYCEKNPRPCVVGKARHVDAETTLLP